MDVRDLIVALSVPQFLFISLLKAQARDVDFR